MCCFELSVYFMFNIETMLITDMQTRMKEGAVADESV